MARLFPKFRPHPLLRGGHRQTIAAAWWPKHVPELAPAELRWINLPDGDRLALHDNCPPGWMPGDPVVVLVHGLAGCHASHYMRRIAAKLNARGDRVFRLDLRGCGAGRGHARLPYHAGRWEDIHAAVQCGMSMCEGSPLSVVGFSLGGNLVLNWLGRAGASLPATLTRGMAVNPPVDLLTTSRHLNAVLGGVYDRHFARLLFRQIQASGQWHPTSPLALSGRAPRGLFEFDELFTAPLSGFDGAEHYYCVASAAQIVPQITVPTLILSAADDPMIPCSTLQALQRTDVVSLHIEPKGGHLGYLSSSGRDPDRFWLDWRVLEWLSVPATESARTSKGLVRVAG